MKTGNTIMVNRFAKLAGLTLALVGSSFALNENKPWFLGSSWSFWYDIDFSKSSPSFPSRNFPQMVNPKSGTTVDYYTQDLKADNSGCFEIYTGSTAGSATDPSFSVPNSSGVWKLLADDAGGNLQPKARVLVMGHEDDYLRIMPYSSGHTDDAILVFVDKLNVSPTQAACQNTALPFWSPNINGGDPICPNNNCQ